MLFASMSFLWIFLPTVLIVNMLLSKVADGRLRYTLKNVWLLIASLIFYAWGGIYYLLIMLFSIVLNYTAGRLMERRRAKSILLLAIVLNLAKQAVQPQKPGSCIQHAGQDGHHQFLCGGRLLFCGPAGLRLRQGQQRRPGTLG